MKKTIYTTTLFLALMFCCTNRPLEALSGEYYPVLGAAGGANSVGGLNDNGKLVGTKPQYINPLKAKHIMWDWDNKHNKFLPVDNACDNTPKINNNDLVFGQHIADIDEGKLSLYSYDLNNEKFLTLGSPKWDHFQIIDVNDLDQVLISTRATHSDPFSLAVWEKNQFHYLEVTFKNVFGINNNSYILAMQQDTDSDKGTLILYDLTDGSSLEIMTVDNWSDISKAKVNDHDDVMILRENSTGQKGFFWNQDNGLVELRDNFIPHDMNNAQQMVGYYLNDSLYVHEALSTEIPVELPRSSNAKAIAINNHGWVVAEHDAFYGSYVFLYVLD